MTTSLSKGLFVKFLEKEGGWGGGVLMTTSSSKVLFVNFLEKEGGWGGGVLVTTSSSRPFCSPVVAGMINLEEERVEERDD